MRQKIKSMQYVGAVLLLLAGASASATPSKCGDFLGAYSFDRGVYGLIAEGMKQKSFPVAPGSPLFGLTKTSSGEIQYEDFVGDIPSDPVPISESDDDFSPFDGSGFAGFLGKDAIRSQCRVDSGFQLVEVDLTGIDDARLAALADYLHEEFRHKDHPPEEEAARKAAVQNLRKVRYVSYTEVNMTGVMGLEFVIPLERVPPRP